MRKAGEYSILLGIKESYLFSRNLLGLYCHPFKTIKVIVREKDYSQAVLIFGFPFYTLLAGFVFIIYLRFLVNAPQDWGWLAKICLFLVFSFSLFVFFYLVYWLKRMKGLK